MTVPVTHPDREHDLPPKWDGHVVGWDSWDTSPVFLCGPLELCNPPATVRCEGCGSTASPATSRGRVYPLDGETHEQVRPVVKRTKSGREYEAGERTVRVRSKPKVKLYAFRCLDCGLDEVFDLETRECWTLDETDYGDEGSTS